MDAFLRIEKTANSMNHAFYHKESLRDLARSLGKVNGRNYLTKTHAATSVKLTKAQRKCDQFHKTTILNLKKLKPIGRRVADQ